MIFSLSVFESVLMGALHTVPLEYGIGGGYPQIWLISRYKRALLLLFSPFIFIMGVNNTCCSFKS